MKRALVLLLTFIACPVLAQSLPLGISPEIIAEFQNLPLSQQRALARQYGITLPSGGAQLGAQADGQLSLPGDAIVPAQLPDALEAAAPPDTLAATEEDTVAEAPLPRFGINLFDETVSTFAPTDDVLVDESYRLGVGDELNIQLFGKENEEWVLQVGRDGELKFPRLGPLTLAGLTFDDARGLIQSRIESELIGVSAVVTMGRLRAINVFMAGEVRVPGAYSMSSLATVTQALFQAGGVSDIGSMRNIQVRRAGRIVGTFDLYDLLMRGDPSGDMRLRTGDVVFVPPYAGLVEVGGEVRRPASYEIIGDESLAEVIAMAGSLTSQAYPASSTLQRVVDNLNVVLTVDLSKSAELAKAVRDGDRITVPSTPDVAAKSIQLVGAVQRPGAYGWSPGMRVSDLIRDARVDLQESADLSYALVVRETNARREISVTPFSIFKALSEPRGADDPELDEYDRIVVVSKPKSEQTEADQFSRETLLAPLLDQLRAQSSDQEPVQVFFVLGAVKAPGAYPLSPGLTVADMITAAGGLRDSAYLHAGELRSVTVIDDNQVNPSIQSIDLEDVLRGEAKFPVKGRDTLFVREFDEWSPTASVQLSGEFVFPGTYLISRGETLRDVIQRAGGLKRGAFFEGAEFSRRSIAAREEQQAREFAQKIRRSYAASMLTEEVAKTSYAELEGIVGVLESSSGNGRLLIDLRAIMTDPSVDIALEDGDTLLVPKQNDTVTVVGEVHRPSTHKHLSELNIDDYLMLSAGLTSRADAGGIYIVRANGQVTTVEKDWWRFDAGRRRVNPGDTIVVPVNVRHKESIARWREVTQILYQSVISIVAVGRL